MVILGIETSCDETSAAIIEDGDVISNIVHTQDIHKKYGGVVPEIASREHVKKLPQVVEKALVSTGKNISDINAVCVTKGPGLIGALLVGISYAKALAYSQNLPIYGINHIEAHLWAPAIENPGLTTPFIGLIISGGHTQLWLVDKLGCYRLLGQTIDDAVGEAYDKVANLLNLNYPGGPEIDKHSINGDPEYIKFPRPYLKSNDLNFSFSGLKTSVLYALRKIPEKERNENISNISASFQEAVIDTLTIKTMKAIEQYGINRLVIGGGVAANKGLKKRFISMSGKYGFELIIPSMKYCTDNAGMIGYLGYLKINDGENSHGLQFSADPSMKM